MLGFHWPELIIVVVVALLVFGPKRLPEMGSAVGKTFKEFKKSVSEITESAQAEMTAIDKPVAPTPTKAVVEHESTAL